MGAIRLVYLEHLSNPLLNYFEGRSRRFTGSDPRHQREIKSFAITKDPERSLQYGLIFRGKMAVPIGPLFPFAYQNERIFNLFVAVEMIGLAAFFSTDPIRKRIKGH